MRVTLPSADLPPPGAGTTLGDVSARLIQALDTSGYLENAWFEVPKGFALVTRMEQINDNGTPKPLPDRWKAEPARQIRNFRDYLKGLFIAPSGRFRLIAFVVTAEPLTFGAPVSREQAQRWLEQGSAEMEPQLAHKPFTSAHRCYALIYEFKKPSTDTPATLLSSSTLTGLEHLSAAGILPALRGPR